MALFWVSLWIALSAATTSPSTVMMAVLVKIDKTAYTSRDLQLNQFMNEYDDVLGGLVDKREPLKELVWEQLLGMEAQELLSQQEVSKDYNRYEAEFLAKMAKDKLWLSMQVSKKEVSSLLFHRFAAKRLIRLKIPLELIEVSDQDVESYYLQNKTQLGNREFLEMKPKILKGLRERKAQVRLKDWLAAVTRSHSVVYMSGFRVQ